MKLGLCLNFKEIKTNSQLIKDSISSINKLNPSELNEFNKNTSEKEYINKKRERDDTKKSNASIKEPNELSYEKKSLINRILKSKGSLLPIKQPATENRPPVLKSSTLSIVNKVLKKQSKPLELTLPVSQPKLSQKALQVIEEINKERKNRFERMSMSRQFHVRNESSFSLRLRNEELIKEERELPIPMKYKRLMNSFIGLDNAINFLKQSSHHQSRITFTTLKEAIETTDKHRFTLETLQQILYVVPHFYVIKWIRDNCNGNDYELLIDIPYDYHKRLKEIETIEGKNTDLSQFDFNKLQGEFKGIMTCLKQNEINERRKVFKNILLEIINEEHKLFLTKKQSDYNPQSFDPFKLKTWHHAFELDDIKDIPLFCIESKPQLNNINSFEQCVRDNDIKNMIIKKALESSSSAFISPSVDKNNNSNSNNEDVEIEINDKNKHISIDLLKRIKKKEEAIKISKEIIDVSHQIHSTQDSHRMLKEIATAIGNAFIIREFIALDELVENISRIIDLSDLKDKIRSLSQMFPNWIKIIKHSCLGNIVVMDKKININEEVIPKI